ncbi:dTDP-4-dehydrorhamnose 3,5-epimerase [Leisingera aquaemixtae]|uniref:dTDP-4-dehydrorhamnose 3,5-epimerase n=2 Tax=Leisingera aquaemixtae TaxID=1396826 RepID=A0A0P1HDA6_9RHOB|nr:dTDP-4-dehydrorhamnose 3,5-epimerase [Leisingera aquaemixtae]
MGLGPDRDRTGTGPESGAASGAEAMQIEETGLPGLKVLTPARFGDARGFFSESWNKRRLQEQGIDLEFVQDNHSLSVQAGTLRGLHFQAPPHAQDKLVRCGRGALFDVAVDIRKGSPAYGQWFGIELTAENGKQLLVPKGFLHGFLTRVAETEVIYKCTDYYAPECDGAVAWNSCGIDWGFEGRPLLSEKDAAAPRLADFDSPFVWEG